MLSLLGSVYAEECLPYFPNPRGAPFVWSSIIRIADGYVKCSYGDPNDPFFYKKIGMYKPMTGEWEGGPDIFGCRSEKPQNCAFDKDY
jgi:hypothetical protein